MVDGVNNTGSTPRTTNVNNDDTTSNTNATTTTYDASDYDGGISDYARSLGMTLPFISGGTMDAATAMLAVKTWIQEGQIDTAEAEAEGIKADNAEVAQQRLDALEESRQKADEAAKGGVVGEVFGWVAAVAMTVAGAVLLATGVGAAVGVALLAGGITSMVMMTLQSEALGEAMGLDGSMMDAMVEGLAGALVDMGICDEEEANTIASAIIIGSLAIVAAVVGTATGNPMLGVSLFLQVSGQFFTPENLQTMGVSEDAAPWVALGIQVGFAIGSMVAGGAAVKGMKAGADAATAGAKAAEAGAEAAELAAKTATTAQKAGRIMGYLAAGISAGATMAQGGSQVYTSIKQFESSEAYAESKEFAAQLLALQYNLDEVEEKMEEIYMAMQEFFSAVMDVLDAASEQDKMVQTFEA